MLKHGIVFSNNAIGGGEGWFEFDPEVELKWSFEETVARLVGANAAVAPDRRQDMFGSQEKSAFDTAGFIDGTPFFLCDWREDRMIHVFFRTGERPKGLTKSGFIKALRLTLENVIPKEFRSTYPYSENVFSWPPSPTKEDAVAMAFDALNDWMAFGKEKFSHPNELVNKTQKARKALLEAF